MSILRYPYITVYIKLHIELFTILYTKILRDMKCKKIIKHDFKNLSSERNRSKNVPFVMFYKPHSNHREKKLIIYIQKLKIN